MVDVKLDNHELYDLCDYAIDGLTLETKARINIPKDILSDYLRNTKKHKDMFESVCARVMPKDKLTQKIKELEDVRLEGYRKINQK